MKHWKKALAVILLGLIIYFMVFHWGRFLTDFWPPDKATVGPNILASLIQWAVILIAVALIYPPTRRAIERYVQSHVDSIKSHVSEEHKLVHEKMDHIIRHHPDIPDFGTPPPPTPPPSRPRSAKKSPSKRTSP